MIEPKVCQCGSQMQEVLNYEERPFTEGLVPIRKGWYCPHCQHWHKAILRESVVAVNRMVGDAY